MNLLLRVWQQIAPAAQNRRLELDAEAIAVKIRWFGLFVGLFLANQNDERIERVPLNLILALGLCFTSLSTAALRGGRVLLKNDPLVVSAMEALFIGLLCRFETGADSPFRYYYFLSLVCCAVRYSPRVTAATLALDALSYWAVRFASFQDEFTPYLLTVISLAWVAWAATATARLLKEASEELRSLNDTLRENQAHLEDRIAVRTRELEESQAQVLHQEKMAAFGLLAAGIAHEVGNPLTSISSIVQMLEQHNSDAYTRQKLSLVTGQLQRIQTILRELVVFSRPADGLRGPIAARDVVEEALGIAKYYKGGKNRRITSEVASDLPLLAGVRDHYVQIVFNLVLNAIDATGKGGKIAVTVRNDGEAILFQVDDDGTGIAPEHRERLFRPYFTTKKQGTGLGLFVVRRLVEGLHGTVTVRSELGTGTTFEVRFPGKMAF